MRKNALLGFTTPYLEYAPLTAAVPQPTQIPLPAKATLLVDYPFDQRDASLLNVGDVVKTGQKLVLSDEHDAYVIATVSGTITSIGTFAGEFGQSYTAIEIAVSDTDEVDDHFAQVSTEPSFETATKYLACVPGAPMLDAFHNPDKPVHTIVVYGGDSDLIVDTNQVIVKSRIDAVKNGIRVLKTITSVERIVVAVPGESMQGYGHIGAEVISIDLQYPAAHPHMIMKDHLQQVVPAGSSCLDMGVCFLTAEAVASMGMAFEEGFLPIEKTISIIPKSGASQLVTARIGTPIRDILSTLNIDLKEQDRLIIGGPMTGYTVFSDELPIKADTNAIMVQDRAAIPEISDYPCVNCGECIRVCPANIPVSMLVRFLEAGQFEDAEEQYDLLSCIDCGLCSYVCVAKIPILQYIRTGKLELERIYAAEAENE